MLVFVRTNKEFDFPVHFHIDYELNFITTCTRSRTNCRRPLIGNITSRTRIGMLLMLYMAGNAPATVIARCYRNYYTISRDLFSNSLIHKNAFQSIRELLAHASKGIAFSQHAITQVEPLLQAIAYNKGIDTFILLLQILRELSQSTDYTILAASNTPTTMFIILPLIKFTIYRTKL